MAVGSLFGAEGLPRPMPPLIHPGSWCSLGKSLKTLATGSPVTQFGIGEAAGDAFFVPFVVTEPVTVLKLFVWQGSASGGQVDLGIYTEDGVRLVSNGAFTATGGVMNEANITDTVLAPGRFYLAYSINTTAQTPFSYQVSLPHCKALGLARVASAHPLPATVTLGAITAPWVPVIGASLRSVVA